MSHAPMSQPSGPHASSSAARANGTGGPRSHRRYYLALEDGLLIVQAGERGWQQTLRLDGYPLTCLACDPSCPRRLYGGVAGHGLLISTDAGDTWRPSSVGAGLLSPSVTTVAVSAQERSGGVGTVYAGTEPTALYLSEDGGASWLECVGLWRLAGQEQWSDPLRPYSHQVSALACDPHVGGRLLLSVSGAGVLRSLDGGLSFVHGEGDSLAWIGSLAAHPRERDRWYAAGFATEMRFGIDLAGRTFPWPTAGGGQSSDDGGAHWQPLLSGSARHPAFWQVVADPADAQHLLACATVGPLQGSLPAFAESVLYQRQGTQPWQQMREGLPEPEGTTRYALSTHVEEGGVFYAASGQGLYRWEERARRWQRLLALPERFRAKQVRALLVWPP